MDHSSPEYVIRSGGAVLPPLNTTMQWGATRYHHHQQQQQQLLLQHPPTMSSPDGTTPTSTSASSDIVPPEEATAAASTAAGPPPAPLDWETYKDTIKDMYMGQNLNLNQVVERMKAYDFHATPRMYKAQFARWGWSKYNCKRMRRDISSGKAVEKSAGKSCHRIKRQRGSKAVKGKSSSQASRSLEDSAVLPGNTVVTIPITTTTTIPTNRKPSGPQLSISSYQIAHANDSSRFVQAILSDIRGHVYSFFHQKPDWQKSPGTSLIAAYNYAFYDSFRIALDSFLKNEHFNGGEILRQAFVEVEGAIQTDYSSTFYFFFIDLPDLFTYYGRHDILVILLQHINRLTAVSLRGKIIGAGFAGLHGLARSDPASLRHYVAAASGLWCDLLQELRGPSDRSTLLARRNHIRHARCCGDQARVRDLCDDYDRLLGEVRNRWGASHNASRHLEDVILLTQLNYGFFTDGFVGRNEKLIEEVGRKYQLASSSSSFSSPSPSIAGAGVGAGADAGTSTSVAASEDYQPVTPVSIESGSYNGVGDGKFKTLPLEAWDLLDRNIRSNCYHRLACYYAHQARIGSGGVDANQEVVSLYSRKAREGWKTNFWQLEVEVALVAAGRLFEAETLRRCRLEAQYFRKLPENDWVAASAELEYYLKIRPSVMRNMTPTAGGSWAPSLGYGDMPGTRRISGS